MYKEIDETMQETLQYQKEKSRDKNTEIMKIGSETGRQITMHRP
jgi:hypothetical protein